MNDAHDAGEELPVYAIRITERAQRDINAATVHFGDTASPEIGAAWRTGLYEAISSLATLPRRCPVAPERFRSEVRQMQYRRAGSHVAYRILFRIEGEEANALDPPTVIIMHIRHASARPLTRTQIREIESQN